MFHSNFFILGLRFREQIEDFVHVNGNCEQVPVESPLISSTANTSQSLDLQNGEHLMADTLGWDKLLIHYAVLVYSFVHSLGSSVR